MKKAFITLLICSTSIFCFAQIDAKQTPQQQPANINGPFLLKTDWDQWGLYAKYSPKQEVLGCWSTALAQILYYHRLKPHGSIDYTCTNGYTISDTLDNHTITWRNFKNKIDSNGTASANAVAKYIYLTAEAIRKDFGTGKYLEMVNPAPQVEKHYSCKATFYISITGNIPFPQSAMDAIMKKEQISHLVDQDSVKLLIKAEIKAKRPVYMHFGNFTTYGHSIAIDGFKEQNGDFFAHINYGSSGFRTGWYNLFKPIDVIDDIRLRAFVTIRPI